MYIPPRSQRMIKKCDVGMYCFVCFAVGLFIGVILK